MPSATAQKQSVMWDMLQYSCCRQMHSLICLRLAMQSQHGLPDTRPTKAAAVPGWPSPAGLKASGSQNVISVCSQYGWSRCAFNSLCAHAARIQRIKVSGQKVVQNTATAVQKGSCNAKAHILAKYPGAHRLHSYTNMTTAIPEGLQSTPTSSTLSSC